MTSAWVAPGQEFYKEYAADEQYVATRKKEAKQRADRNGGVFGQHLRSAFTTSSASACVCVLFYFA